MLLNIVWDWKHNALEYVKINKVQKNRLSKLKISMLKAQMDMPKYLKQIINLGLTF